MSSCRSRLRSQCAPAACAAKKKQPLLELSKKLARRLFRPTLESLEERVVLDAVVWHEATSGNWNVAANWLDTTTGGAKVPTSADQVSINETGVTVTVSGSENADTLTTAGGTVLDVTAGSLTLAGTSTLSGNLDLSGGTFTTDAVMTLAGASTWTGGVLDGTGSVTNTGTLSLAGTSATSPLALGVRFDNAGTITQTGAGSLGIVSGTTFTNQEGGVYDLESNAGMTSLPGPGDGAQFLNAGTFQKTAGTGPSTVATGVTFEHAEGTVDVETGTVAIEQSGTAGTGDEGADFTVAHGAVLNLSGPSAANTLEGTFTGSGSGTVLLASGFLSTGAEGATFNFPAGLFQWTGGTIANNGGLSNQGTITLSGSGDESFGPGVLDNTGTIVESGGQLSLEVNTTILNESGASYDLLTDATLGTNESGGGGGDPVLVNEGTFDKSAGGGSTTMSWDLQNLGTFEVGAGSLTQTGNLSEALNQALTGGTWVVSGGASLTLTQAGSLLGNQADVTLSGSGSTLTNFSTLRPTAGTLQLLSGADLSTSANLTNNGTLAIGPASTLNVTGNFTPDFLGHARRATGVASLKPPVRQAGCHRLGDACGHAPGRHRGRLCSCFRRQLPGALHYEPVGQLHHPESAQCLDRILSGRRELDGHQRDCPGHTDEPDTRLHSEHHSNNSDGRAEPGRHLHGQE